MGDTGDVLVQWLLAVDTRRLGTAAVLEQLCARLNESGLALRRVNTSERTLHPEVYVRTFLWVRGEGVETIVREREILGEASFRASPLVELERGGDELRRRLTGPDAQLDYPICSDLAAEGYTDYFLQRLDFQREGTFVSWATDAPGGFSAEHLALLRAVRPALALVIELSSAYFATESLLEVYLGANAAREVLSGAVTRGTSTRLRAALFFCDLRGFTSLADRQAPAELIALLDRYLERVVDAVAAHGGEVLKFIGDAVLAIFAVDGAPDDACRRALAAARDASSGPPLIRPDGEPLRFGIALHLGEVSYGNIGGRSRLDFTVIGAAVNEASRVEALCKELGCDILVTADFAAACPDAPLRSLGRHPLRGVAEPAELFTLD